MSRKAKEVSFTALSFLFSALFIGSILWIILEVFLKGLPALKSSGIYLFLHDPYQNPPGVLPSLLGSLITSGLAIAISIPISLLSSVMISEFPKKKLSRIVKALSSSFLQVPTVVIGIFVYTCLVSKMRHFSLIAASLALSIVAIPYLTSYFSSSLRSVPRKYKEAAYSIGMSPARASFQVSMKIARRGLLSGALLGFSKVLGETAPLLFTLGGARGFIPFSLLFPGDALPLLIYVYAQEPYKEAISLAWGSSLILLLFLFSISLLSRSLIKEVKT